MRLNFQKVSNFQKIVCENCQFLNFALIFVLNRTEFDRALDGTKHARNLKFLIQKLPQNFMTFYLHV